jgi:copper chaperone
MQRLVHDYSTPVSSNGLMTQRTFVVEGMTCEHCRAAVVEEVAALPGVASVEVDLARGRLTVEASDVDDESVAGAVSRAGYRLGQ